MSVAEQVEKTLSKILIERIVLYHHFSKQWKLESQIPKIRVEFVDINSILKRFKGEIGEMKKHFAVINEVYDIGIEHKDKWGFTPEPKYTAVSI